MGHRVARPSAFCSILFYSTLFYGPRCHQSQEKNISANFFSHKEVTMQQEKLEDNKLTDVVYWTAQTWKVNYQKTLA